MTDYKASKRIVGTEAERPILSIPHWQELDRYTLSSGSSSSLDTGTFTTKPYMMILAEYNGHSSASTGGLRFNSDTGSNYARRQSTDGGADGTGTSETSILNGNGYASEYHFSTTFLNNSSSNEKLTMSHVISDGGSTGSGSAPRRREIVGKWANTSNNITSVQLFDRDGNSFQSVSEVVVLGYDPADTGTSVWEELASVDDTSAGNSISSGTFTAKKYLMIQARYRYTSGNDPNLQFNSDTGNNYSHRRSTNGGSDSTATSTNAFINNAEGSDVEFFDNIFIINKSDKEKIGIIQTVTSSTTSSGTAPQRREYVGKWDNTSSQITSVQYNLGTSGNMTGSIKVWGFD